MKLSASVIGGINLDVTGFCSAPLVSRDSNPGVIRFSPGGVGRNIAEQLARAGADTRLFTAVSKDAQGEMLIAACRERNIDLSFAKRTDTPSSCYLSIHDANGDMALAVNDMQLIQEITPEYIRAHLSEIMKSDVCVVDANLTPETIAFIRDEISLPIVADPVSCIKAKKLLPLFPRLAAFKPNMLEAEYLTGETTPEKAACALLSMGIARVIISLGEKGAYYADSLSAGSLAPSRVYACQTNGAGDAMCAGVSIGAALHESARLCAERGLASSESLLSARV